MSDEAKIICTGLVCIAIMVVAMVFAGGCLDESAWVEREQPSEEQAYNALPAELQKVAMQGTLETQPARMSAVVTLWQSRDIRQFRWTAAVDGAPATRYEVQAFWVVPDTSTYLLTATGKDFVRLRVRGIDSEGRAGPWSGVSDTLITAR